ncbi:MAG: phage holin family protein [Flavobacteriales bacterium]|nr:phage holin family protein [Flavobacteriales bacterium]
MRFLINIILSALAVIICAYLLPGVYVEGFVDAFFVALAIAFLNQFVKPLLVILTIPATILTLGLFLLVINAAMIELADWIISDGFEVDSFLWALFFSLLLTVVTSVLDVLSGNDRKRRSKSSAER